MAERTQAPEWRVEFDAEVTFGNGGGLQAQGFRLDIPGDAIEDGELAELFVAHLGLLMVDQVAVTRKVLLREPHKGSRGVPSAADPARRDVVAISDGATRCLAPQRPQPLDLLDLPGTVVRVPDSASSAVDRALLIPLELRGRAVVLDTGARLGLTADAAAWLVAAKPALVAMDTSEAASPRDAVTALRDAGVPVLTGVRPEPLPPHGFRLHAVPAQSRSGEQQPGPHPSWPVFAYAVIDGTAA